MARTVLTWSGVSLFVSLAALAAEASPAKNGASCPPKLSAQASASLRNDLNTLEQRVTAGPLYKDLARQYGIPRACQAVSKATALQVSYTFTSTARLDASIDPALEFSEQRLERRGLDKDASLSLLKLAETDAFGKDGCGIQWNAAPEQVKEERPGWRDLVYRGEICNCQARILYLNRSIQGLVLSSSC